MPNVVADHEPPESLMRRCDSMKTRVQKWGNSLALRIPKSFAADIGRAENVAVDMSVSDGRLVIQSQSE